LTRDYDEFLDHIELEQAWRFRLCANPVHSVKSDSGQRGKIYGHVTVGQQKQWLLARSEKNGFILSEDSFDVVERNIRKFNRGGKLVTLSEAIFEGLLTVTDSELFTSALRNGIGRAKAYGCGLITLVKP